MIVGIEEKGEVLKYWTGVTLLLNNYLLTVLLLDICGVYPVKFNKSWYGV